MRPDRYAASADAASSVGVIVVGALMMLGFGALVTSALLDALAFPDAPLPTRVAEAVNRGEPPRGTWVELTDARLDCAFPPAHGSSGSLVYAVLRGPGGERILMSSEDLAPGACDDAVVPRVGELVALDRQLDRGLEWARLRDRVLWPSEPVLHLVTTSGPGNAWGLVAMFTPLVLVGLALVVGGLGPVARRVRERAGRAVSFPVPRRVLALPLATGGAALRLVLPMASIVPILVFGPLFVAEHLPEFMTLVLGVAWAAWFFAVCGVLMELWTQRASDVLLAPEGLVVRGGPLHAVAHRWRELDPRACRVEDVPDGPDGQATRLLLAGEVAAASTAPDERASLAAVADTVRALVAQARGEALPAHEGPAQAVSCPSCGAPVALRAASAVTCHRCGAAVPLPDGARAQLAALAQLESSRRTAEDAVRRLLAQPGAHATNLLLLVSLPPLFLGWPLAAIIYDELHQFRGALDWQDGAAIFAATLAFTYGLSWRVRAQVSGREAIRLLSAGFAARPPDRAGDPPSCRTCGAALPVSADAEQLVALCAYCQSENLLAVNLVPPAAREAAQAERLGDLLTVRLARRRRLRRASWASLVVLIGAVLGLAVRFR